MNGKTLRLASWGRLYRAETLAYRPERVGEVAAAVAGRSHPRGLIAYGRGRSYGDAPLNSGGETLLTERLNRLLSFDESSRALVCEAGVTFNELMSVFLPRGFLVPVNPGTGFATIGGAVANDVHGKNHDHAGSFGRHVEWLDLVLPAGEVRRVSRQETPDLFAATVGGVGLTGIILQVCFRLTPVPSSRLTVHERRIPNLDAFIDAFEEQRSRATYSVGWIDGLARGAAMGRGILETAEFAESGAFAVPPGPSRRVPLDLPAFALNPLTVRAFNELYFNRFRGDARTRTVPARDFFYPLDALRDWNRIYGRKGFHQFQCVLPNEAARPGLRRLLTEVSAARAASFLAVLKTLGDEGPGYLSFPMRGFTLALDFPGRPGAPDLLARLQDIVCDHGGRVYLAKDAVLTPERFRRMYPKLDAFRTVLGSIDPECRFRSDLERRLRIRGDP